MIDPYGRTIDYVRLSITDRCDLRCRYCMSESMQFVPNAELLTIGEIGILVDLLIDGGVSRVRLTGGEPLVRRDVAEVVELVGARVGSGLSELTLTTNGTQLPRYAAMLSKAGVRRVNVSLDSLDPVRFRQITRRGDLEKVLAGISAGAAAGLKIKINMVALAGFNEDEIVPMLEWCAAAGHDLTLIETMPMGDVGERRSERFLPLTNVLRRLQSHFTLVPSDHRSGGPARYHDVAGTGVRLGMITPLTENFCGACNRIRITATGSVYGCLGRDQSVDLRAALRCGDKEEVGRLLDRLIAGKPERHGFDIGAPDPAVARHMSVTGG